MNFSKKRFFLFLFCVASIVFAAEKEELCNLKENLSPVSQKQYFLRPDVGSTLIFRAPGGFRKAQYRCVIHNFSGKIIGETSLDRRADGTYAAFFRLPRGFFTVTVPEGPARFGLCVLPAATGRDPFFGIETLLREEPEQAMAEIMTVLREGGIFSFREFPGLGAVRSDSPRYKAEWDLIYRVAARLGMKGVCSFSNLPPVYGANWDRRSPDFQPYPTDLARFNAAILDDEQRRRGGLEAFQVMNEVDMLPVPGDRMGGVMASVSWAFADRKVPVKLCAQGFANVSRNNGLLRTFFENGLAEYSDILAIHSYDSPEELAPAIRSFRKQLELTSKPYMPVWITECGKPWLRGFTPDRVYGGNPGKSHPALDEETVSAAWIVMKGVEAKACGIERYYPFVLKYFPELQNNFGMTDAKWAPLLPLAAYFQSILELGGLEYAGDFGKPLASVRRARIFRNAERAVLVLYSGENAPVTVPLAGIPARSARALDGSPIPIGNGHHHAQGGAAR